MKACRSAVALACGLALLAEACCAVTFAEWRKNLMSVNPGLLKPQCKKVFKACNVKLISLVGVMEVLKQRWEEYTAVPCVKGMLSKAFPDFSEECSMSGFYGKAVIGKKQAEAVAPAFKCLIDNALP
ncbi:uncharacterized protein LOC119460597 isoform X2 [Dermacentor silvarum]|uniref:uncharacterized protein LOC119460597 isoform X2 n=1 Tax=Dermacentor silvarum TaxID=543639 RepID=UPI0021007B5D|nr:uncharacterized protein LOC119460597 isoform X2 [Dermacentor silvarum]